MYKVMELHDPKALKSFLRLILIQQALRLHKMCFSRS